MAGLLDTDPLSSVEELIRLNTAFSTERDLNRLLHMILSSARKLACAEAGRVYILDPTGRLMRLEVLQNDAISGDGSMEDAVAMDQTESIEHLGAYCAFTGKLVAIDDIYDTGLHCSEIYAYDERTGYRTRSVIAVPLRSHKEYTIGVLELFNHRNPASGQTGSFPKEMEGVVQAFASMAAVVVDNTRLIDENQQLIDILDHTNRVLEDENKQLRQQVSDKRNYSIIGDSPAMKRVFTLMEKVLDSDATVLLRGETGTGKELFASVVHTNGRRRKGPFIAQNCAALPETLLESELFGFKKGAFSGATTDKKGLIEAANGGTLFLDEVGDMPIGLQAKLLRVLQEGEVRPLGHVESRRVNVRFIAATNADLETKIRDGDFREDLFYRLCVFPIDLPPLRERREDLPALLNYFLKKFSDHYEKALSGFSPAALTLLLNYDYPGNIRELSNIIERAVLLCDSGGSVLGDHLPSNLLVDAPVSPKAPASVAGATSLNGGSLKDLVQNFEASIIEEKLRELNWNQSRAAEELKMPRRTLIEKLNRYNIRCPGRSSSDRNSG